MATLLMRMSMQVLLQGGAPLPPTHTADTTLVTADSSALTADAA